MQPSFEKKLLHFNEVAKTLEQLPIPVNHKAVLQDFEDEHPPKDYYPAEVSKMIQSEAAQEHAPRERIQRQILNLQIGKQEVVKRVWKDLAHIDDPEYQLEKWGIVPWVRLDESGNLQARVEMNQHEPLTEGQLFADLEWGRTYYLHPEFVSKSLRKEYTVAHAREQIWNRANRQIALAEGNGGTENQDRQENYRKWLNQSGREDEERYRKNRNSFFAGMLAEKLVRTWFTQICRDLPLDIEVESGDVYEDISMGVDFYIIIKPDSPDQKPQRIAVQFTINDDEGVFAYRSKAVARKNKEIDENTPYQKMVLIRMAELKQFPLKDAYDRWLGSKKPGGPIQNLGDDFKYKITEGVLKKVLSTDRLQSSLEKVRNYLGVDGEGISTEHK